MLWCLVEGEGTTNEGDSSMIMRESVMGMVYWARSGGMSALASTRRMVQHFAVSGEVDTVQGAHAAVRVYEMASSKTDGATCASG